MKRLALFLLSLALLGTLAARGLLAQAEHATSISRVERLNRAPVSKEVLKVSLPRPAETRLPNGLTVLVLEQHKLPTVSLVLWIKTGALNDPPDLPGLAGFTADMLHEGTTHRTSAQLAADVDAIGASLHASAGFGSSISSVMASGLAPDADRLLELMSDIVLNPTFPADELGKFQTRELAELQQERAEPGFLSQERFRSVLYRSFPAAVFSPTADSIKALTPGRLKQFHDEYYVPNNAILGVVGDVKAAAVLGLIKKRFGEWKGRSIPAADLPALAPAAPSKIYLVDRPSSVQTNIVAGDYGARRLDDDYVALTVMNRVLGGGPTGRLFLNLREEKGYTYGAYSSVGDDVYREAWQASTEVRPAVTDGSMHELMYEFKRIRDEKVPEAELDEARHALVANFALSLEQPSALLTDRLLVHYYGLPSNYWDRYPAMIAGVSQNGVQEAARKYVDLDHLQIVCVGDGKQIRQTLEKYGPVELYDANGKKID